LDIEKEFEEEEKKRNKKVDVIYDNLQVNNDDIYPSKSLPAWSKEIDIDSSIQTNSSSNTPPPMIEIVAL
jgi:hypothetical protein